MADQTPDITGAPPTNAEVAGVSSVMRVRLDAEQGLDDVRHVEREFIESSKRMARGVAEAVDTIRHEVAKDPLAPLIFDLRTIVDLQEQVQRFSLPRQVVGGITRAGAPGGVPGIDAAAVVEAQKVIELQQQEMRLAREFADQERRDAQKIRDIRDADALQRRRQIEAVADAERAAQAKLISDLRAQGTANAPKAVTQLDLQSENLARLKVELSQLRDVQRQIEREWAKGTGATREQSEAWQGAERRARAIEGSIKSLSGQLDKYEREASQAIARTRILDDMLGRTQRLVSAPLRLGFGIGVGGGTSGVVAYQTIQLLERGISALGEATIGFQAKIETATVGLRQFVKDGEQADILLKQITQTALSTPLSLDALLDGSRRLLAMGVAADKVLPTLRSVSAAVVAVGGDTGTFNRVILAISQIGSKAKLSAQDMRQLAEAGIPVFKILQQELGLTAEQTAEIGKQAIDSRKGLAAILTGMDRRFAPGLILGLDTLQGRFDNLQDIAQIFLGQLGGPLAREAKEGAELIGDALSDPQALAAMREIGDLIGRIAHDLREATIGDGEGLIQFLREMPALVGDVEAHFRALDLFMSEAEFGFDPGKGLFGLDLGSGPQKAEDLLKRAQAVFDEAREKAKASAAESKIQIGIVGVVRDVDLDLAKARINVQNAPTIDLSGFTSKLEDDAEISMARGLSVGALKALDEMLSALDQEAEGGEGGRSMAHIAAQLREVFITELAALGDSPSLAQVQEAVNRLADSLVIPGQFGASEADQAVIQLTRDTLLLNAEQSNLANIQADINQKSIDYKALSNAEEAVIRGKTKAIKDATDARKAESEVNKIAIENIGDQIEAEQRAAKIADRGFDKRIKDSEATARQIKNAIAPILAVIEAEHTAAANALDDLKARQERTSQAIADAVQRQGRVTGDLRDTRSVREAEYKTRIDEATDAERRHREVIQGARDDLEERLGQEDELLDKIKARHAEELGIADNSVDEQERAIREARRASNREDRELARQQAAARQAGNKEEVERIRELRAEKKRDFQDSIDEAEAELQTRRDNAEKVRDQIEAESAQAKAARAKIESDGQANIRNLEKEGHQLAANKTALEEERDTALGSLDKKIALSEAFAKILTETGQDFELAGRSELARAQALEKSTQARLTSEAALAKEIEGRQDKATQAIRDEKTAFDETQATIIEGLTDRKTELELTEKQAERTFNALIKPQQDILDKLKDQHTANDLLRQDELDKTRVAETEAAKRIKTLDTEIDRLKLLQGLNKDFSENATARAKQEAPTSTGEVKQEDPQKLISDLVAAQGDSVADRLDREIAAARKRFEETDNVEVFKDIVTKLRTLVFDAGLVAQISPQDIAEFVHPERALPGQAEVPAAVLQLMQAVQDGDTELVSLITRQNGFLSDLTHSLVGTGTLSGSDAIRQQLEEALPKLRDLDRPAFDKLVALLEAQGFTITDDLRVIVPSFKEFTEASKRNADVIREASKTFAQQQARAHDDAVAARAANDPAQPNVVSPAELVKAVAPVLFPNDNLGRLAVEGLTKEGDFPAKQTFATNIRTRIDELLATTEGLEQIQRSIASNPNEWKALLILLGRTPVTGGQGNTGVVGGQSEVDRLNAIDERLRSIIDAAGAIPESGISSPFVRDMQTILDAADRMAGEVPKRLGALNSDENRNTVGEAARGLVEPGVIALNSLPQGADGAVSDVVGRLEGMGLPENVARVSAAASNLGQGIVQGIRKVASSEDTNMLLDGSGNAMFGAVAGGFAAQSTERSPELMLGMSRNMEDATGSDDVRQSLRGVGESMAREVVAAAISASVVGIRSLPSEIERQIGPTKPLDLRGGSTGGPGAGGKFINPLKGSTVTSEFNEPREWGRHGGLDLNIAGGDLGAPIQATADGIVSKIKDDGSKGLGRHVEITHAGGFRTQYGHMLGFREGLHIGQEVPQGYVIGYVGSTGNSTGPHLHYAVIAPNGAGPGKAGLIDPRSVTDLTGRGAGARDIGGPGVAGTPAGIRGQGVTVLGAIREFLKEAAPIIEDSGGDLAVVLDAIFSGATELAADKIAGFSRFAQDQMLFAFDGIKALISELGGPGMAALRQIATAMGLVGTPEENAIRAEMRRGHPGMEILERLGNVPDRSALLSLIAFLQEHSDDPAFSQLFDTLRNATGDDSLFTLLGRILIPANDPAFAPLLDFLARLGPEVQKLISAPALTDLLGDNTGTLRTGELLNLLQQTQGSAGFADIFRNQLLNGLPTDLTIGGLADQFLPTDAASRRLVQFLIEQFGREFRLDELRKQVLDDKGQLLEPAFVTAPVTRDPAARGAARQIREFALSNQFITDTAGARTIDPAVTSLLAALQNSEAKTLDEFLRSPDIASILPDDTPLGRFIKTLQGIAAQNPDIALSDLQGFLFGGEGFTSQDVVDATNDVRSAVETVSAILLGATDSESIAVWKALLHVWEETAPELVDNTAATAQAAQATANAAGETAENTGKTASGAPPTGTSVVGDGGTVPGGTTVVDTRTPQQKALDEAKAALARAEAEVQARSDALEAAQNSNDPRRRALLAEQLAEAERARDEAAKKAAGAEESVDGSSLSPGEQSRLRRRLESMVEGYRAKMEAARARGDDAGANEFARRLDMAEAQLEKMDRAAGAKAEGLSGDFGKAVGELEGQIRGLAGQQTVETDLRKVLLGETETQWQRENEARRYFADVMEQMNRDMVAVGTKPGWPRNPNGALPGDVGGDVGGGRAIEGLSFTQNNQFTTNVQDAYNPLATAHQIANTQVQTARLAGEKGGKEVRGILASAGLSRR